MARPGSDEPQAQTQRPPSQTEQAQQPTSARQAEAADVRPDAAALQSFHDTHGNQSALAAVRGDLGADAQEIVRTGPQSDRGWRPPELGEPLIFDEWIEDGTIPASLASVGVPGGEDRADEPADVLAPRQHTCTADFPTGVPDVQEKTPDEGVGTTAALGASFPLALLGLSGCSTSNRDKAASSVENSGIDLPWLDQVLAENYIIDGSSNGVLAAAGHDTPLITLANGFAPTLVHEGIHDDMLRNFGADPELDERFAASKSKMVGSFDPGTNSDNAGGMIYTGNVDYRHECAMEAYAVHIEERADREINTRDVLQDCSIFDDAEAMELVNRQHDAPFTRRGLVKDHGYCPELDPAGAEFAEKRYLSGDRSFDTIAAEAKEQCASQ